MYYVLKQSVNYTARNVIIPAKHLRANEIELGYITFLELFKLEIISLMGAMYDIPDPEVWSIWQNAVVHYDDRVYKVMQYMVRKGVYVEINRNPTINYLSQIMVRVVRVKPDISDFTMSLPLSILKHLNADFDGDVLNIISVKLEDVNKEYYNRLNPMKNMFISRNDGKFNADAGLFKDQAIELFTFLNI